MSQLRIVRRPLPAASGDTGKMVSVQSISTSYSDSVACGHMDRGHVDDTRMNSSGTNVMPTFVYEATMRALASPTVSDAANCSLRRTPELGSSVVTTRRRNSDWAELEPRREPVPARRREPRCDNEGAVAGGPGVVSSTAALVPAAPSPMAATGDADANVTRLPRRLPRPDSLLPLDEPDDGAAGAVATGAAARASVVSGGGGPCSRPMASVCKSE
mmetsp:Transcript_6658/g.21560  ORF Transcript_6658/g.21560 Transcript_6658/m.21560 type:complete len:216 (-) Transcript_6658:181-828(-)